MIVDLALSSLYNICNGINPNFCQNALKKTMTGQMLDGNICVAKTNAYFLTVYLWNNEIAEI